MLVNLERNKVMTPEEIEQWPSNQKLINKGVREFKALTIKIDKELDKLKPSKESNLTWTKMAALFGRSCTQVPEDNQFIWDRIVETFGDECDIGLGALLQLQIAKRDDIWLLWPEITDRKDRDSGDYIKVANYWIDNNFDFKGIRKPRKPRAKKVESASTRPASLEDLKNKFKRA